MKINNVARLGGILAAAVGLTAAGVMAVAQAQQSPGPLKIGVMDGFSGVYGDLTAGEVEAMQLAIEDVGGKVLRPLGRDPVGRPPDQARRRRRDRAQVVRRRRREDDHRPRHLVGRAGGPQGQPGEGPDRPQHRRRLERPHRPGLLADRRALGLRHLLAGPRDRRGDGEGGRRQLVLPHRRLRLRPCAGARRVRGREGGRRQGAGRRAPSAQHAGLLVLPAAGPGLQGQGDRPRQCRPGHDQLDQAGGRVRHRQGRPEARRPAGLRDRRAVAHAAGGAGPGADRGVLLGSQRRDPRLDQALPRQEGQAAVDADGRRLQRRPCTISRPCRPPAPTTPRR